MADVVLFFGGQFRKGLSESFRNEQGVIAEAIVTPFLEHDVAAYFTASY